MTKLNKENGFFHRRTNAVDVETAKIPSDYNRRAAGSCVAVSPDKAEPVPMQKVSSRKEVLDIFEQCVSGQNAEGLVVRSEQPVVFKVKPKHSIDAVVAGYTEGIGENSGQVRDIMFAVKKSVFLI